MPNETDRHRLLSEQIENLTCLSPTQTKYLRERGVRYLGELYYVHFDARSRFATEAKTGILEALQTFLGLPSELDPLCDGWTPPYWSTPGFLEALSTPVIEILSDKPSDQFTRRQYFRRNNTEYHGYNSEPRWVHNRDIHYMGMYLENLRGSSQSTAGSPVNSWSVGKLRELQIKLNHSRRLWAAALIPPDWQAPKGVPEVWTRLLVDKILPAIEAEEERRRNAEDRKRSFALWQARQSHHEKQFLRGAPVMFNNIESDETIGRPIQDLWPRNPNLLERMHGLGVTTVGQILQLSKEEVILLLKKVVPEEDAQCYCVHLSWWLHDQNGLLHPVALNAEDAVNHPIPQFIIDLRARRAEIRAELSATNDSLVTDNLDNLLKRCDELELSVRTANCLQNSGIEYIWQLCEYTEAKLLRTKYFGRKSLLEVKEILGELGLKLEMQFSEQARGLLTTR